MRIIWTVDDGYVNQGRNHYVNVPDEDLEGLTEDQRADVIDDYVKTEFENKISYSWDKEQP